MISIHVSAVLRVRDGYTGREVKPSSLVCAVDGLPCRPVGKDGGYLVFTGLAPGAHTISLRGQGFLEELVEVEAGGAAWEIDVTMKPGPNYPFRQTVTRLTLTVLDKKKPAAGRLVWLAAGQELKIAQTKAEAGSCELRVFFKGPPPAGTYLITDDKHSEIVSLRSVEGETAILGTPLQWGHARSKCFLPAQRYRTGEDGTLSAVLRAPCTVQVYAEGAGLIGSAQLAEGDNQVTLSL